MCYNCLCYYIIGKNNYIIEITSGAIVISNSSGPEWCYNITINDLVIERNQTSLVALSSLDSNVRLLNNIAVIFIVDDGTSKSFFISLSLTSIVV